MAEAPTGTQPAPLAGVVYRNIASLLELRRQEEAARPCSVRVADGVTNFVGSMAFVYLHLLWFGGWIILNSRWVHWLGHWDPYPFVMLAMIASVEAIFLSTFILITQNRMQRQSDKRADLDLHISLLAEHELTQLIRLSESMARHLHAPLPSQDELGAIEQDVTPTAVASEIQKAEGE